MQDPYYDPNYFQDGAKSTPFDGEGNVSAFRIKDGTGSFKQRYVYTKRIVSGPTSLWTAQRFRSRTILALRR